MVASRFENSLFSRPWMAQTGVYPGQPAATPQQAATPASAQPNAPLQIMAGSLPASGVMGGGAEGLGGSPENGNLNSYGTSPSFGSFATNVLSNLGPLGMAVTLGTMVTDPQRSVPYGILGDVFGWGQPERGQYAGETVNDPALTDAIMGTTPNPDNPFGMAQTPGQMSDVGGDGYGGSPTGGAATGTGTGTEDEGGTAGIYQRGGYTGAGQDGVVQPGMPAGTVHEGEQVINAASTRKYGTDNLAPLNEGKVPRNKLVALAKRYR